MTSHCLTGVRICKTYMHEYMMHTNLDKNRGLDMINSLHTCSYAQHVHALDGKMNTLSIIPYAGVFRFHRR